MTHAGVPSYHTKQQLPEIALVYLLSFHSVTKFAKDRSLTIALDLIIT